MSYLEWHVGMKVVCVNDDWSTVYPGFTYPQKGKVYEITALGVDQVVNGEIYEGLWIAVAGASGPGLGRPEFSADNFRPVQTRKTDISIFTAMLTGAKEREKA